MRTCQALGEVGSGGRVLEHEVDAHVAVEVELVPWMVARRRTALALRRETRHRCVHHPEA